MASESVRPSSAITSSTPLPVGEGGREGENEGRGKKGKEKGRENKGREGMREEGGRQRGRTMFANSLRWHS